MKNVLLVLLLVAVSDTYATNVALNKSATATTQYTGYGVDGGLAKFAVDGDLLTCWNAGTHAPPIQSLTVDLQTSYFINEIDVWTATGHGPGDYVNYSLYVSMDKNFWQFISSDTLIDTFDVHKVTTFSPIPARYIRYDVTGGTHWAHLYEMQVYDVPEPATLLLLGLGGLLLKKR